MAVVSERFQNLAAAIARARGKPEFPMIVLPANIEELSDSELHAMAEKTFPEVLEKLTDAG